MEIEKHAREQRSIRRERGETCISHLPLSNVAVYFEHSAEISVGNLRIISLCYYLKHERKTCNNTFTQHLLRKIGLVVTSHGGCKRLKTLLLLKQNAHKGSIESSLVSSQLSNIIITALQTFLLSYLHAYHLTRQTRLPETTTRSYFINVITFCKQNAIMQCKHYNG